MRAHKGCELGRDLGRHLARREAADDRVAAAVVAGERIPDADLHTDLVGRSPYPGLRAQPGMADGRASAWRPSRQIASTSVADSAGNERSWKLHGATQRSLESTRKSRPAPQ